VRRFEDQASTVVGRRGFLAAAGAAPLLCTLGTEQVSVGTADDAERLDRAAAAMRRPAAGRASQFAPPEPEPGGRFVDYWVAARSVAWDAAPRRRDGWMGNLLPRVRFRALVYQLFSSGFARPVAPAGMPGPVLHAEVGDVLRVHFRNMDRRFRQPLTMHAHGVRYTPDYDGAYLGRHTRVGGFLAPGDEFTYLWEARPDSVGVWPYHDHGPNHTLNTMRGLFGALVVRPRGEAPPDVEQVLMLHSMPPQVTRADTVVQAVNGRTGAGNTPTVRARVGQDVAFHAIGFDAAVHTFHIHGHRWRDAAGQYVDCPGVGPNETVTARFREDNPGRWLYHCHFFTHQPGMAGWYLVDA
jgi:FtsP/CotA-like multicopper oxidase with cupredoxin domain